MFGELPSFDKVCCKDCIPEPILVEPLAEVRVVEVETIVVENFVIIEVC